MSDRLWRRTGVGFCGWRLRSQSCGCTGDSDCGQSTQACA